MASVLSVPSEIKLLSYFHGCTVQKTTILLQRSARLAFWPSPYLDVFGEEVLTSFLCFVVFMVLGLFVMVSTEICSCWWSQMWAVFHFDTILMFLHRTSQQWNIYMFLFSGQITSNMKVIWNGLMPYLIILDFRWIDVVFNDYGSLGLVRRAKPLLSGGNWHLSLHKAYCKVVRA